MRLNLIRQAVSLEYQKGWQSRNNLMKTRVRALVMAPALLALPSIHNSAIAFTYSIQLCEHGIVNSATNSVPGSKRQFFRLIE